MQISQIFAHTVRLLSKADQFGIDREGFYFPWFMRSKATDRMIEQGRVSLLPDAPSSLQHVSGDEKGPYSIGPYHGVTLLLVWPSWIGQFLPSRQRLPDSTASGPDVAAGKEEVHFPAGERRIISCFKGLAPVSMPAEWLSDFDTNNSFASVDGEARIRFPNGRAFGVRTQHAGANVSCTVRKLSAEETAETSWGKFAPPWEAYSVAKTFGHGPVTALDKV